MPSLRFLWTSLILALVACGEGNPLRPVETALQRNQQLWQEVGPANYRYTFQRLCFCVDIRPVEIEVRAGAIVSVTVIETGEELDTSVFDWFETVDGLFDMVLDAIDRKAERLEVTYHPTLGYPTDIDVDYSFNIADEEQRILASGLVEQ